MRLMWPELLREFRWFLYGRTGWTLILTSVVLSGWSAIAGATSAMSAMAAFRATLARYQENGEDIAAALRSPSTVEGSTSGQLISNPLRHDLDAAALALTQLDPPGAIAASLSLCAILAFPVVGFALGVFVATHDLRSGSIIVRWPRSRIISFAASKPLALVIAVTVLTLATGALAAPFAWMARQFIAVDPSLRAFEAASPSVDRQVWTVLLAVLGGTIAATLGLLVGSATRNRTFAVAIFTVAYLLLPLLGAADPRNLLTLAGDAVLFFPGQFHPVPIAGIAPDAAVWMTLALALAFAGLSTLPWLLRGRTERTS